MTDTIETLIQRACEELGYRLYLLDWNSHGMQVYIDKKNSSISISDCEKVSKRIHLFLAGENIAKNIRLEVSSPGLDRKLKYPWHFNEVIGRNIHVTVITDHNEHRSVTGTLTQVHSNGIVIENTAQMCQFSFSSIKSARLVCTIKKIKRAVHLSI